MPGPLMHRAAMRQCRKLLKQINIPVTVGKPSENMKPDLGDSHGWDFYKSNSGSLLDKIENQYEIIKQLVEACGKDFKKIDKEAFSEAVRFLCHYTEDAHSIGQLSSKLWGKIDNKIDIRSEFVTRKRKYKVELLDFKSKEAIRESLYDSMKSVYNTYHERAESSWFLVSRHIRNMAWNAVKCGAEYTAAYVNLALHKTK